MRKLLIWILMPALLLLGGCSAGAPATGDKIVVKIALADGSVTPLGERLDVKSGQEIELQVTSDRADELHIHGFDTTLQIKAGESQTHTFTADRTGRYEIETHSPALTVVILQIR